MKKFVVFLVGISLLTGILYVSTATSDQFVNAGSTKKFHFTDTVTSAVDPGQGHESNQLVFILSPNEGTIYDGSITFTASKPIQVAVFHEILPHERLGQPTWTIDGETIYGFSLIDLPQRAGSLEFTGGALGLHAANSDSFTATVSVDGWIRGQPADIILQQIEYQVEEPSFTLSRTSIPVTIPMHKGVYEGGQVLYIITDGSDSDYVKTLSEKQQWNVETSAALADMPEDILGQMFVFTNGVRGDGLYGFQDEVFSSTPSQESEYSALHSVTEVSWKAGQREIVFESVDDIIAAEESGRINLDRIGVVLNTPQVIWPDGQMTVREDPEITDDTSYDGGQIVEIDQDEMTATFIAHRGWGPDGRTIYYIVTDVTPLGPAQTIGVVNAPTNAELISHPGTGNIYQFKNGIPGSGALGFQPEIADVSLDDESYSPMWKIYLVEWHDADAAKILESVSDLDSFRTGDLVTVSIARPTISDYIINSPLVDPFQQWDDDDDEEEVADDDADEDDADKT